MACRSGDEVIEQSRFIWLIAMSAICRLWAIDVIDEAAALVRVKRGNKWSRVRDLSRQKELE